MWCILWCAGPVWVRFGFWGKTSGGFFGLAQYQFRSLAEPFAEAVGLKFEVAKD